MSDELLAMLEARSPKFTPGRGGVPELTALDVASALGMGADKFASLAFQIVRGGSVHMFPQVDELLACHQFGEWRERAERMVDAQLKVACAHRSGQGLQHAKLELEGARAAMWPPLNDYDGRYEMIRRAVVAELRFPRICQMCQGTKHITKDSRVIDCTECRAAGVIPISDRQRAIAMKVDHANYLRAWRPVYEWTYWHVSDAVITGREEFEAALK